MDTSGRKEIINVYTFDSEDFNCSGLGLPGTNCIGGDAISWFAN